MAAQPPLTRSVPTRFGEATAALVDSWLGVSASGDLLERDIWEVTVAIGDLRVTARVMTFQNPSSAQLAAALEDHVDSSTGS